jgi:hypothetical protein
MRENFSGRDLFSTELNKVQYLILVVLYFWVSIIVLLLE